MRVGFCNGYDKLLFPIDNIVVCSGYSSVNKRILARVGCRGYVCRPLAVTEFVFDCRADRTAGNDKLLRFVVIFQPRLCRGSGYLRVGFCNGYGKLLFPIDNIVIGSGYSFVNNRILASIDCRGYACRPLAVTEFVFDCRPDRTAGNDKRLRFAVVCQTRLCRGSGYLRVGFCNGYGKLLRFVIDQVAVAVVAENFVVHGVFACVCRRGNFRRPNAVDSEFILH